MEHIFFGRSGFLVTQTSSDESFGKLKKTVNTHLYFPCRVLTAFLVLPNSHSFFSNFLETLKMLSNSFKHHILTSYSSLICSHNCMTNSAQNWEIEIKLLFFREAGVIWYLFIFYLVFNLKSRMDHDCLFLAALLTCTVTWITLNLFSISCSFLISPHVPGADPGRGCRRFQREGAGNSRGRVQGIPPSSSCCSFLKVVYLTSQPPFLSGAAPPWDKLWIPP